MEAMATMQAGLEQLENQGLIQKIMNKILKTPFDYFNRLS